MDSLESVDFIQQESRTQ